MQDMLVPIFGENGSIIIQYVVTLAVILGLIALVVWAIRRYGRPAGPTVRGRLPRLAVVDALPIDAKRRLVLVRRDNVEHLVLIGGPTDVVVEPSIVRQRVTQRPGQSASGGRTTQPAVAPQPPPPPPAPTSQAGAQPPRVLPARAAETERAENAIPFPPRRSPLRASERFVSPRRETTRTALAASAVAVSDAAPEPPVSLRSPVLPEEDHDVPGAEQASPRFAASARSLPEEGLEEPVPGYPPGVDDDQETVSAFAPPTANNRTATVPEVEDSPGSSGPVAPPDDQPAPPAREADPREAATHAAQVSDLEKEMARLLDEISTSRRE